MLGCRCFFFISWRLITFRGRIIYLIMVAKTDEFFWTVKYIFQRLKPTNCIISYVRYTSISYSIQGKGIVQQKAFYILISFDNAQGIFRFRSLMEGIPLGFNTSEIFSYFSYCTHFITYITWPDTDLFKLIKHLLHLGGFFFLLKKPK